MKLHHAGIAALTAILLLGCPIRTEHKVETTHKIEAHIVIDVRKVQEQAEQIESEVRAAEDVPKAEPDPGARTGAMVARPGRPYRVAAPERSFWSIFDLATSAHAAESDEDAAIARRKERAPRVREALDRGCLGENNTGYLEIRPCDKLEDAEEKARLQVLAEDENRDRRAIYTAIARRQGLESDQADAVGAIYAGEIRKLLRSGQAFQIPTDDQLYEEFLESDLGRKLDNPRPGAWIKVP